MLKTCFFIGHREADEGVQPLLNAAVEKHIRQYGVTQFIVGHHGRFDAMAGLAVKNAKKKYPNITLLEMTPYHPAERKIALLPGYDGSFYPFEEKIPPRRYAIVRANELMIHQCDYLIAFVWHPGSNARIILEKAEHLQKKGGIHVENIGKIYTYTPLLDLHSAKGRPL